MDIIDLTSSGYVYRWSLESGFPRCVEDAISPIDTNAMPALQRNAAIRAVLPPVLEYEAAQALVEQGEPENGESRQIPAIDEEGQPVLDDEGRPVMVDNPGWALLPRTRAGVDPETGETTEEPEPRWVAYDAAVALIAGASAEVKALALWRQPEPSEDDPERLDWVEAKLIVETAINQAAQQHLEVDPRPVPEKVMLWQAKAILAMSGRLEQAETIIAAANPAVAIFWASGQEIHRSSPTLAELAVYMPLSETDLDNLFRGADAIKL